MIEDDVDMMIFGIPPEETLSSLGDIRGHIRVSVKVETENEDSTWRVQHDDYAEFNGVLTDVVIKCLGEFTGESNVNGVSPIIVDNIPPMPTPTYSLSVEYPVGVNITSIDEYVTSHKMTDLTPDEAIERSEHIMSLGGIVRFV